MSNQPNQSSVVQGVTRTKGGYIEFPLVDLSYYPNETLCQRIMTTLYGAKPTESLRWQKAQEEGRAVASHCALANTNVEGKFLLFLPENERPWGMMEVSELNPIRKSEQDLTLAVIPSLALMPFRLYIDYGEVWESDNKWFGKFYVVDRERSNWSVHCH